MEKNNTQRERVFRVIKVSVNSFFKKLFANTVLLMISGSIIGFLLALIILFFEDLPYVGGKAFQECIKCGIKPEDIDGILNDKPEFLTWIMLFIIQTGISISLGFAAFQNIRIRILSHFKIRKTDVAIAGILVVIMMLVSSCSYLLPFNQGKYYIWPDLPLNHLYEKIVLLLSLSIVPASSSVLGMILIGCVCRKLSEEKSLPDNIIDIYIELKETLERFLLLTGIILTGGMITVYFFYASLSSMNQGDIFTQHSLIIFGLMFTIFIGITFIPSKLLLNTLGRKIITQFHAHPSAEATTPIKDWVEARNLMEEYLALRVNSVQNFKDMLTVLTPILGSLIPSLLTS